MLDHVPVRNVRRSDVLARFCLSPNGLHKNLKLDRFPQPFYIGGKPLWREADLAAVEAGTWKPASHVDAESADIASSSAHEATPAIALPRKLGRPRGSKNKPNA